MNIGDIDLDELTRDPTAAGGSVNLGGRLLNASRQVIQIAQIRKPNPPAPEPVKALEPGLSERDVVRLIDQRDAAWRELTDSLQKQIDILIAQTSQPRKPHAWRMKATYLADGSIDELLASPTTS